MPAAVLVSPGEFEFGRETIAVRFAPALMDEIGAGLADLRQSRAEVYTQEELFQEG